MPSNVAPAPGTGTSSAAGAEAVVPAEAVTPLIRGIAVLRRLTDADGVSSLSGLERSTGLARSTVDRITATLARRGYVRLDGRDAVLAPRLMELGNAYLAALRLPRLLDAHADALADELDESVSLAVGDQDGIRFIHQATRRRAMSLSFRIGDLLPAERTAPGPLFATEWGDREWARWHERRGAGRSSTARTTETTRRTGSARTARPPRTARTSKTAKTSPSPKTPPSAKTSPSGRTPPSGRTSPSGKASRRTGRRSRAPGEA